MTETESRKIRGLSNAEWARALFYTNYYFEHGFAPEIHKDFESLMIFVKCVFTLAKLYGLEDELRLDILSTEDRPKEILSAKELHNLTYYGEKHEISKISSRAHAIGILDLIITTLAHFPDSGIIFSNEKSADES